MKINEKFHHISFFEKIKTTDHIRKPIELLENLSFIEERREHVLELFSHLSFERHGDLLSKHERRRVSVRLIVVVVVVTSFVVEIVVGVDRSLLSGSGSCRGGREETNVGPVQARYANGAARRRRARQAELEDVRLAHKVDARLVHVVERVCAQRKVTHVEHKVHIADLLLQLLLLLLVGFVAWPLNEVIVDEQRVHIVGHDPDVDGI